MTWFRVDDRLPDHRKARKAGTAAMGLWVLSGAWSSGHLTDGWVPEEVALRYGTKRQAERLVAAGLWFEATVDGEPGWVFHQWTEHQPTREQVQQRRKNAAERQANWRSKREEPAGQSVVSRRDSSVSNGVSHAAPVPTRPEPNQEEKNSSPRSARTDEEFDAFYASYPKKAGRKAAEKAWAKAIKDGVQPAVLIEASKRYAIERSTQDPKFTKHPATWLNQGCWDDEPARPQLRAVSGGYQPWTNPVDHSVYDEEL